MSAKAELLARIRAASACGSPEVCDDGPRQLQVRGLHGDHEPVLLFNRLAPSTGFLNARAPGDGWVRYSTEGEGALLLFRSTAHSMWVLGQTTNMTDDRWR